MACRAAPRAVEGSRPAPRQREWAGAVAQVVGDELVEEHDSECQYSEEEQQLVRVVPADVSVPRGGQKQPDRQEECGSEGDRAECDVVAVPVAERRNGRMMGEGHSTSKGCETTGENDEHAVRGTVGRIT